MGLEYHHLDEQDVRDSMPESWQGEWLELHSSGHPGDCYGKQLSEPGWEAFGDQMPEALSSEDDDWLMSGMDDPAFWLATYPRRKPKGGFTQVNYNKREALEKLCIGEFNAAYIRGLASALLARGETECEVYRAGPGRGGAFPNVPAGRADAFPSSRSSTATGCATGPRQATEPHGPCRLDRTAITASKPSPSRLERGWLELRQVL